MAGPVLTAASRSGDIIEVHDHKVIIKRSMGLKLLLQGLKGEKEIPIRSIAATQFKQASMLLSGYIQFTLMGGPEAKGGWQQAGLDENTVEFVKAEEDKFRKVKDAVDAKIDELSQATAPPPPPQANNDPITQLERLAALRSQGVLSDEEFAEQKAKILGTKQAQSPVPTPPPLDAPAAERTEESTIPCPNCGHPLPLSTIRIGENWCPLCRKKYVAEH